MMMMMISSSYHHDELIILSHPMVFGVPCGYKCKETAATVNYSTGMMHPTKSLVTYMAWIALAEYILVVSTTSAGKELVFLSTWV